MVRLGKTFGNLMVDVVATNEKLRARVRRIVAHATGEPRERVDAALDAADGDAKVAIVSLLARRRRRPARARLDGGGRRRPEGARPVRLGVEAALVDGRLVPGDVAIDGGSSRRSGSRAVASGIAAPGFVDLQVNGFARRRLPRRRRGRVRDGRRGAARDRCHRRTCRRSSPRPRHELVAALRAIPARIPRGPRILGAHLEGPFLSPHRLGTHPATGAPDPDPRCSSGCSPPGRSGSSRSRRSCRARSSSSTCSWREASSCRSGTATPRRRRRNAAFDRGVRTVTHLFNAMRPFTHRDPGIVGAALVRPDVVVQVIVDGIHLDRDIVRLLWTSPRAGSRWSPTRSPAPASGTAPIALGALAMAVQTASCAARTACWPVVP